MKCLFNAFYLLTIGKDLSTVPLSDLISSKISVKGKRFINWLCYFMVGTSMENTSVLRFIDNKTNKENSIRYIGKIYDLFISEGALDQGYPRGGLQSIINSILTSFPKNVDIKTNEEVLKIDCNEKVEGVITEENYYECDTVIYSGSASNLPYLVDDLPEEYVKNLVSIKNVNSLTIWLGLTKKLFKNYGSQMWIDSDPFAWLVPTSNYDPNLAPPGNQLASFAFILPDKYNESKMKKKAFNAIVEIQPEIERHIDMTHYQYLIPEKASWSIKSGFGDVKTPITNLYCVGTDTIKRSAGVSRAAYSVLRCLELVMSNEKSR